MNIGEIYNKYNIDTVAFIKFVKDNNLEHQFVPGVGFELKNELVDSYVEAFKKRQAYDENQEKIRAEEEARKRKAMAEMLITSGFHFDGYRITKYSGYISGDDAISVDRGVAGVLINTAKDVQSELMNSLAKIRRNALHELKEAAYDLGCNAVIGVDFDYITLDPQTANWNGGTTYLPYVFGVTANGNAVIIEKVEDDDDD